MISRRITRKPENDNYRRLANYIADASRDGEKCLLTWCTGCWADDDYGLAIQEVADTQALNTRTLKEKTYHLIVSFRPEDEARLTTATLKEIESELAKALGFEEHQRHCGVHKNTANLHMHVAYNMIHPEKLTRHDPFRDYHTRDRVCRELEKRFGLTVDNGRDQERSQGRPRLGDRAATVEAHTGQQSFEGYATGHRIDILASLERAGDWQALHRTLALLGLEIKPHGNGLIIKNRHGKQAIKASRLDRSLAKGKLEKRFGPFLPPDAAMGILPSQERYQAKPLHRDPARGNLFAEYQVGIAWRKAALAAIKDQEQARKNEIARIWECKRHEIAYMALTRRDRFTLLKLTRQHEARARSGVFREVAATKQKVLEAVPYASWNTFLRWQAAGGNEMALAILRSMNNVVEPEQRDTPETPMQTDKGESGKTWQARRRSISDDSRFKAEERRRALLSVTRMRQLEAQEATLASPTMSLPLQGFTYDIDNEGTVLFVLANGSLIRDVGGAVLFSVHDDTARRVAIRLAGIKWGKCFSIDSNKLQRINQCRDRKLDVQSWVYRPI